MTRARPLRFLALVLGLWVGARAVMLAMPGAPAPKAPFARRASAPPASPEASPPPTGAAPARPLPGRLAVGPPSSRARFALAFAAEAAALGPAIAPPPAAALPGEAGVAALPAAVPGSPGARRGGGGARWSGSAWLLLRGGGGQAALAPGGTLGGSQAGARLLYRIGAGLALSGRAYAPLRRPAGAEAAAGIDWQPVPRLPVHLLAERRQNVGGAGRSAFAVTLYGGTGGRLPGGLSGEAYAQAGIVGIRSRDLFLDAAARVSLPAGRIEAGLSAWAAAQPGAARLDAGPHLSYRLPVRRANLRLQADWRFRIAGEAAPGSGPALTIAADF